MVERIAARAAEHGLSVDARVMDGQALQLAAASFDGRCRCLASSCSRTPSAASPRCGGWCAPAGGCRWSPGPSHESYELAAEVRAAVQAVWPEQPPAPLPAQLRYREVPDFRALFKAAGLNDPVIVTSTARLEAPSARWLSERISFAPGMAATMAGLGGRAPAVLERLVANLEARLGQGPIGLSGVTFIGTAEVV